MSIEDERELRGRLDGVLEAITPPPAPVAATIRRGKTIRIRRRIGVVGGLAAAVGIALAAPGLVRQIVRQPPETPVPRHRWVVTVYPPGPHPTRWEIAWGTINGKRWVIYVTPGSGRQQGQCVETNLRRTPLFCAPYPMTAGADPSTPVSLASIGNDGVTYEAGVVQPDVARMVITLKDGTKLTLYPYPRDGQRWVAFALPSNLAIANGIIFSRPAELAYAIPYGNSEFVTWLRPGEQGLPRATYVVASGVANGVAWSDIVHAGPWGYCLVRYAPATSGRVCIPAQARSDGTNTSLGTAPFGHGTLMDGTASPAVAYVVGTLTDASTVRALAVDTGGLRFWAWIVPRGQRLRRVVFYSASGRQVAVQSGAEYNKGL